MISRVRLEAYGESAGAVEESLNKAADILDMYLFTSRPASRGEMVIDKQLEEPPDSDFAFKGRLIMHPGVLGAPVSYRMKQRTDQKVQ